MLERYPESKPLFTATLPNYELIFVGWSRQQRGGVASIKLSRGDKVLGVIYEVSERDLVRLDSYEAGYNRLNVTVFSDDGKSVQAVTYIKSGQLEETKPSREYLATIQQGFKDWGII